MSAKPHAAGQTMRLIMPVVERSPSKAMIQLANYEKDEDRNRVTVRSGAVAVDPNVVNWDSGIIQPKLL
jgi:hypothetical protein